MKLKILYVCDLHSRFEELAKIASCIGQLRDDDTLVLDAGDNADFSRIETEGTNGVISSAILNKIGFTARVFGNNEGFSGKENGRTISETSDFPVITCNMYDMEGHKLRFLDDAVVLEKTGTKILMIGVTASANVFYHLFGIHVKDPLEEVQRVLSKYDRDQYDLLIVLSHLGLNKDKELASKFPQINLIIGGHSHLALDKPVVQNQTIICQAGSFGEYLGELQLDFDSQTRKIRGFSGRLVPSRKYPPDPEIMQLIRHYSEQADKNMSKPVFVLDTPLDHSLTEENALGNLLADSLRDIMKTEIGIINSGVLYNGIKKGVVTKKLLHDLSPSPLNPTYFELKGIDIRNALEKSLQRDYQLSDGRGAGFRGKNLGNIQISNNVQVRFNPHIKQHRITSIKVDGKPLDLERWYTVATSDYLQRGSGYSDFANNRNERYRVEFLKDVLELYLQKPEFVKASFKKRFTAKSNSPRTN